jgi:hypothetical protein
VICGFSSPVACGLSPVAFILRIVAFLPADPVSEKSGFEHCAHDGGRAVILRNIRLDGVCEDHRVHVAAVFVDSVTHDGVESGMPNEYRAYFFGQIAFAGTSQKFTQFFDRGLDDASLRPDWKHFAHHISSWKRFKHEGTKGTKGRKEVFFLILNLSALCALVFKLFKTKDARRGVWEWAFPLPPGVFVFRPVPRRTKVAFSEATRLVFAVYSPIQNTPFICPPVKEYATLLIQLYFSPGRSHRIGGLCKMKVY